VAAKRVPSKSEYIRLFALAGALPACVQETIEYIVWTFDFWVNEFTTHNVAMPRRMRRAFARFDRTDITCVYDSGLLARMEWYLGEHRTRAWRSPVAA
jgi:hypothetical protein